jgi:hypothetical protein
MAVSYLWPASLPQVPQKGYTEDIGVNVLRTPMDAGPAKMRRRSRKPAIMNVTFFLTTAQVATLENFVTNTIGGVARFGFTHPRTKVQVETRIVPQDSVYYKLQYVGPGYYTASMQFEILP